MVLGSVLFYYDLLQFSFDLGSSPSTKLAGFCMAIDFTTPRHFG